MFKVRNLATLMAVGALAGLTGCSALGLGGNEPAAAPAAAAAPAPAPMPAATPTAEMTPQMLRRVQTALKHGGLYHGRVDGKWGPLTQNAVTQYQTNNGLQATGSLDEPTLQAMHMASAGSMGASGSMGSSSSMGAMGAPNSGAMPNQGMSSAPGAPPGGAMPGTGTTGTPAKTTY